MKRHGVERVIARALLTDKVRAHLASAGEPILDEEALEWRSWPQMFGSTTGPWSGIGGAAVTSFQVAVAVGHAGRLILVFAGSDLLAYGWTDASWFWAQVAGASINTRGLQGYGLTVLDRALS